jgi:hypothetical protein
MQLLTVQSMDGNDTLKNKLLSSQYLPHQPDILTTPEIMKGMPSIPAETA